MFDNGPLGKLTSTRSQEGFIGQVPTSPPTRAITMTFTWSWEVLAQSQDVNNNIIIKGRYSHPSGQSGHSYACKTNSP